MSSLVTAKVRTQPVRHLIRYRQADRMTQYWVRCHCVIYSYAMRRSEKEIDVPALVAFDPRRR